MLYDFHTHTFLSDGVLLPIELIRRAAVAGYTAVAVTDHASAGNLSHVLEVLSGGVPAGGKALGDPRAAGRRTDARAA